MEAEVALVPDVFREEELFARLDVPFDLLELFFAVPDVDFLAVDFFAVDLELDFFAGDLLEDLELLVFDFDFD